MELGELGARIAECRELLQRGHELALLEHEALLKLDQRLALATGLAGSACGLRAHAIVFDVAPQCCRPRVLLDGLREGCDDFLRARLGAACLGERGLVVLQSLCVRLGLVLELLVLGLEALVGEQLLLEGEDEVRS